VSRRRPLRARTVPTEPAVLARAAPMPFSAAPPIWRSLPRVAWAAPRAVDPVRSLIVVKVMDKHLRRSFSIGFPGL
jgi:hypothetical protein